MGRSRARDFWRQAAAPSLGSELTDNPELSALNEAEQAEVLGLLPPLSGRRVLELGAGTGRYTRLFARQAESVLAVDLSPQSVRINRQRLAGFDNVVVEAGDVTELDLGREQFDLVFINWLLLYLDDADVQQVIRQAARALRVGGTLFVHESCRPPGGFGLFGLPVIRLANSGQVLFESGRWWQRLLAAWQRHPLCYFRTLDTYTEWLESEFEPETSGHLTTYEAAFDSVQQHFWRLRKPDGPGVVRPVGDSLAAARGEWQFGAGTWKTFDQHVRRSIPFYDTLHELIVLLAEERVRPGGHIVELGCSTGNLTYRLSRALTGATVLGIDSEPGMIAKAQTRQAPNLAYSCSDIRSAHWGTADLAILCYTLQFLPVEERPALLQRVYNRLADGGVLVLAEKVQQEDREFEQLTRRLLHRFKRQQGFSQDEIDAKDASLEGVLTPLTEVQNERLLKDAGFRRVWPLFRNTQFVAWMAVR